MAMRKRSTTTRRTTTRRRTVSHKVARPWSREEVAFMRKFYRNYETTWIARQMGRTVYSVRYKAVDLNIKKSNPSVWRGNRGAANSFRKPTSRAASKPVRRTAAKRSTTRTKSWRASSKRKPAKRSAARKSTARKSNARRVIRRKK